MKAKGLVHKFGDNVDTDVIIPARYLNRSDEEWLASHCMEDIDADFAKNVKNFDAILGKVFITSPIKSLRGSRAL